GKFYFFFFFFFQAEDGIRDRNVTGVQTCALPIYTLIECGGGQVVVADGKVLSLLELPIAGINTDLTPEKLAEKELELKKAAQELGCQLPDTLFYLSFLPITSIPDLALTDGGNVDYTNIDYFEPVLSVTEA